MRALIILLFTAISLSSGLSAIVESYSFTNINRVIPDGVASGMQDTRSIQSSITSIGEVTVTLKISGMDSGAYNGDLYVALQHGSGLAVLLNRVGRSSTNKYGYGDSGFDVQFKDGGTNGDVHLYRLRANGSELTPIGGSLTGSWQPDARVTDPSAVVSTNARSAFLQQFRGMSATGGWSLLVTDVSPGGRAQLDSWSLDISTEIPKPLYSVTKVTTGSGSIILTPAKAGYTQDETFQSTAVPDQGYMFSRWEGIASGQSNPASLSISSNSVLVAQFLKIWSLTLQSTAGGTISSSASGTNVVDGTTVALTAVPSAGYAFTGWAGALTGTNNPASFSMLTNKAVSANFVAQYALDVGVVGGGTVAQAPLKSTYLSGDSVILTATASAGWAFVGWSGDATSSTASFALLMNGKKSITATFRRVWTVSSSVVGTGGNVTLSPVKTAYLDGSSVTATAVSSNGFKFIGWSGDLSSLSNSVTMVVNTNKAIVAKFAPSFILTLPTVAGGTVAASPQQSDYASNSVVTLVATPSAGFMFKAWTNGLTGSTNPTQLIMNQSKTVQPVFVQGLTLTTNVVGAGSLSVVPARSLYFPGETVTITAVAGQGSSFTSWSGASTSTNPVLSLTISSNTSVTANFNSQITLATSVVGGGTVLASPAKASYLPGESVTVTAAPSAGWTFTGWSGASTATTASVALVMNSTKLLTATFRRNWTVSTSVTGLGTVSLTPNQANYLDGTTLTAVATPSAGNKFIGWGGDLSSLSNSSSLLVNTNKAIIAKFAPLITLNIVAATGGTAIASPQQSEYVSNSVVGVTATPLAGYLFKCWTNDASGSVNPYSLIMNQSKTVQPIFVQGLTLTTNVLGSGSFSVVPARSLYFPGETVTITAVAGQGSAFISWSGASTSTNPILSLTISSNTAITANFIAQYALTTSVVGGGTVLASPAKASYLPGESVTVSATPSAGWTFTGWSGASTATTASVALVMNSANSLTATFQRLWTVSSSVSGAGSVSLTPNQATYPDGTTLTAVATPAAGNKFIGWSGDLSSLTTTAPLLVNTNKAIIAKFAPLITLNIVAATGGTAIASPQQSEYVSNSVVGVTATPLAGYLFKCWTNDASGSVNPYSLIMNQSKTVQPVFVQGLTLTTNVVGAGSLSVVPARSLYFPGETVTITAVAGQGSSFTSWSGASTSTNPVLSLTISSNTSVTANFASYRTLTVTTNGLGSVTTSPLAQSYVDGTVVSLTATAGSGWIFANWSGALSNTSNPLYLVMNGDKSVTANFIQTWPLSFSSAIGGTATATPFSPTGHTNGSIVSISANAAAGYVFAGWTGDLVSTNNPANVVMDSAKLVTPTFRRIYQVTLAVDGNGNLNKPLGVTNVIEGTTLTITAISAGGNRFAGWSGSTNAGYSMTSLSIKVNGNLDLTANFLPVYVLTIVPDANGSVSRTPLAPFGPALEKYFPGTNVSLTAVAKAGYVFVDWIGSTNSTANPLNIVMNTNQTLTPRFASLTGGFLLDRTVIGDGTLTVTPNKVQYTTNELVTIQCVPGVGSTFGGVSGTGAPSDTNQTAFSIIMDGNKTILAQFNSPRSISVNTTGLGSVSVSPLQSQYFDGMTVTFTTIPAGGCRFAGWTGSTNTGLAATTLLMKVSGNLSLTANFLPVFSLTASSDTNGSVSRTPLAPFGPKLEKYFSGSTVTLNATPKTGFQFVQWTINGTASTNNPLNITMNSANVAVATFAPLPALASLNLPAKSVTLNWDAIKGVVNLGVSENEGESGIEISYDLKEWQELGGVSGSNLLSRKPSSAVEFYRVKSPRELQSAK